jgi:hypothetical protein
MILNLSATQWTAIGPAPTATPGTSLGFSAGRIEVAAPDPKSADVLYAGANGGGVWKTGVWYNDPPTWLPVTDDQPSLNFAGYHPLVVHPANSKLVLGVVSGPGAGVLKSTNAGLGWTLLANNKFEGAQLGSIAVHPTDTKILYVSVGRDGAYTKAGVYKSTDSGVTWQNTTAFHSGYVTDVIIAKFNPQYLYAGLVRGYQGAGVGTTGVYRSTDAGVNWQLVGGLPNNLFLGDAVRLESGSATGSVYVTLFAMDIQANVTVNRYKTNNAGQAWTPLAATPGNPETRSWHVVLAVDPKDANHVFANDAYVLFESKDGGNSWVQAETIGDDWVNMTFDANGNGVVTADRNLYRYEPKTNKWFSREGNLQVTEFYDVTADMLNVNLAYGVAQDHVASMKFTGSILWDFMKDGGGETGKVLVDAKNSKLLYVSNPLAPATLVARSTNGGANWTAIFINNNYKKDDYDLAYSVQKSFAMDPQQSKRLLIGMTRVFECKDATVANPAWAAISGVLSPSSSVGDQYITALAIAPSNSKTVYAATADGHVWTTTNGGANWSQNDSGLLGSNTGFVVDLRIDPANPKRAFAVTTGAAGKNIWFLDPATGQWKSICGNMPKNLGMSSICADWKAAKPVLYAGTARNVYQSIDLGTTWKVFGLYMPNTVVSDLQTIPASSILLAGTYGRGAWEILMSTPKKGRARAKVKKPAAPRLKPAPLVKPYRHLGDLTMLPGRQPGQPLVDAGKRKK